MEISMTEQGIVFLFSCVVGGFLGAFYDVFRIIRIAFNSKWLSVFFQDLIFCIFSAISVILLVFYTNSGTVRWFSLLGCFICFVLYHLTIGKIIIFMAGKIIAFIKKVLKFIYKITVIPVIKTVLFILKLLKKLSGFMLKTFDRAKGGVYYKNEKRKIIRDSSRGFDLYKPKSKPDRKTAKNIAEIMRKDSAKNQKTIEKTNKKR